VAKVTTVTVAVVAVGAAVLGTGGLGATVIAGVAVGGVISGFANESDGGSYINGYVGGAIAGGIQAGLGYEKCFGPLGTIVGGAANGVGACITDQLDNLDPYNDKYKTQEQIKQDALQKAGKGIIYSMPGGLMQWMTGYANHDTVAKELMEYTKGMGEGLNQIYSIIDNLLISKPTGGESLCDK